MNMIHTRGSVTSFDLKIKHFYITSISIAPSFRTFLASEIFEAEK
jgi:hypothetical protein